MVARRVLRFQISVDGRFQFQCWLSIFDDDVAADADVFPLSGGDSFHEVR